MLKKLAAVVLVVGLCLPYSCNYRPIVDSWDDAATILGIGIPVLIAIVYALQQLVPGASRYFAAQGQELHGVLRMVYFVLAGFYLGDAVRDTTPTKDQLATGVTLVVTGVLLYWQQGRGSKADRLPLLLLTGFGLPALSYFLSGMFATPSDLQIGGWLVTAGWLLATVLEAKDLAAAPPVTHGG